MRKIWEGIKSVININTTKNESINCLSVNSTKNRPFCCKQFLHQVFHNECQKVGSGIAHTHKSYTDHLTNPLEKTFFLTPTSPYEVGDIIKTLNLRKSVGPYSIPKKLLKKFSKALTIPISTLTNQPFVTGIFSEPLKLLSVIPIFKKADPWKWINKSDNKSDKYL